MEANKVASLMRRRENLKPITALHPVIASVLANRSLPAVKIAPSRSVAAHFRPVAAALAVARDIPASSVCLTPKTLGAAGESATRLMERNAVRLRTAALAVPSAPRKVNFAFRIPQARITMLRNGATPPEGRQRLIEMALSLDRRLALGGSAPRRALQLVPLFKQACRVRPVAAGAAAGRDLRVSNSRGFRPPPVRLRSTVIAPRRRSALAWNDAPRNLEVAYEFPAPEPTPEPLAPVAREPRLPAPRVLSSAAGRGWPATRPLQSAVPGCEIGPALARVLKAAWNTAPAEASLRCEWYQTMPGIVLGYAEENRRARSAETARTPVPADIRVEENFSAGCGNWVGGIADWRLDAAGARTGSLALFAPSLELVDYELEFLVRVESRSVTWVFRAADTRDYYRATLRIAPEGGYEFTRSAVIADQAEPAVSALAPAISNARTAMSVRTSVKGSEFAVFVEGQAVDRWSDDRLPVGGVGFGSAADDRARLYWMRLTYAGSPGLKDVKR